MRAVTVVADTLEVVRDEDHGLSLRAHRAERVEALLLKVLVADGEHLVEQENVELHLDRDGIREPYVHPGRIVLQLLVDEALELGELEDRVESFVELGARGPSNVPLIRMLSRPDNSGLKPPPSSMNGETTPFMRTVPVSWR